MTCNIMPNFIAYPNVLGKKTNVEVGEEHSLDHQNGRKISPGQLFCSGSLDLIRMNILDTCDKIQETHVRGSGESSLGNCFASYFLQKIEISPAHCRNLKYNYGQEIRSRPTILCNIIQQETPQSDKCKQRSDWSRKGSERIFNRRSSSSDQGRKVWRKKIRDDANNAKLKRLVDDLKAPDHRLILRSKNTVFWMNVQGNTVTGTVLAATKIRGFLCAHYNVTPP